MRAGLLLRYIHHSELSSFWGALTRQRPAMLKIIETDALTDCPLTVQLPPTGNIFSFFQDLLRFALQRKRTKSETGREMP